MSQGGGAASGASGLLSSVLSSKAYGSTSETRVPEVGYAGTQFSPTEMFDLSENITTNIYTINGSWKQLEQSLKGIGTAKDSKSLRDKVHVTQLATNQVITQTTKDLQRLTIIVRKGDKLQKLQVDKLTTSFKEAVQTYSKIMKQVADKMKLHLLQVEIESKDKQNYGEFEEEQTAIAKQKMAVRDLEFEQSLILERNQRVKQIEDDMLDLNQIMKELGSLVYQQSDVINSIENSIEVVHDSVEAGTSQLEKAAFYANKRRRKTCILLGIAVVVGVILAVIITVSLK